MSKLVQPSIWFPTIRTGTGTDTFTERLVAGLRDRGLNAEITWLPHHAEYFPWAVKSPSRPKDANLVHINTWLPKRFFPRDVPIVATLHHSTYDSAVQKYKSPLQRAYHSFWISKIERRNIEVADAVVAVSNYSAEMAKEKYGRSCIRVIHNGIDLGSIPSRTAPPSNSPFRLAYVGGWRILKGVDLIPRIMQKLGPEFELLCIGGVPSKVERQRCPPNISWTGRIEDHNALYAVLKACDALLFPSRSEGLSLSLLEAQACGLPVIAAARSSIPEVVIQNQTGFLCNGDDSDDFVASIRRVADNVDLRRAMGEAARRHVQACFHERLQVTDYIDCYHQLLGLK
jgi:glycosyltransferase involved in cell wall biosynthesis